MTFSDELLNAYVDGELDGEEAEALLAASAQDPHLKRRLQELAVLKAQVQEAFGEDGAWERPAVRIPSRRYPAVAAALCLIAGALLGWGVRGWFSPPALQVAAYHPEALRKVILHVDSAEPERLNAALDEAESLLAAAARERQRLRLEIIANAGGLELLRADNEAYARRIRELLDRYDEVTLLACRHAIARYQEKGRDLHLLPEVKVAPSAVDQIVKRLKAGWIYIKV